jgi:TIR domain
MVTRPKPHVFLSHVREDAGRVERLAAGLEARGIEAWIDRHQIKPGQRWQQAIEFRCLLRRLLLAGLRRPHALLHERGAHGRDRGGSAQTRGGLVVHPRPPRRVRNPGPADRPGLSIGSFQRLDMFPDWDKGLERLAETIGPSAPSRTAVLIDSDWLRFAARQARLRIDYEILLMRMREAFGDDLSVSFQMSARGARSARFMAGWNGSDMCQSWSKRRDAASRSRAAGLTWGLLCEPWRRHRARSSSSPVMPISHR